MRRKVLGCGWSLRTPLARPLGLSESDTGQSETDTEPARNQLWAGPKMSVSKRAIFLRGEATVC